MSQNLLTGLVGAWCPSLGPSGYTLLDRSGRGQHGAFNAGMVTNAGASWQPRSFGWTLAFDGSGDAVEINNPPQITGNSTVGAWFEARSLNRRHILYGRYGWYAVFIDSSNRADGYAGSATMGSPAAAQITTGQVYHILLTTNRTTNVSVLYLNGRSVAGPTAIGTTPMQNQFAIGDQYQNRESCDGWIGDVGVWNRILTAPEVASLYLAGPSYLGQMLTGQQRRREYALKAPSSARRRRILTGMV